MKATLVKGNLPKYRGSAALYKCEPPLDGNPYVVVSAADVPYSGPETYIFAAAADGNVVSWSDLEGSYRGGLDHEQALSNAGYTVVASGLED